MKQPGFSLIEVAVATVLSTMLAGVLYTSLYQSNRSLLFTDEYTSIDANEVTVLHQLERDLAGALFIPPIQQEAEKTQANQLQPQEQKKIDAPQITKNFFCTTNNGRLDVLTFLTLNPRALHNGKPRLVRVMYRLKPNQEKQGAFILTRQESHQLDPEIMEVKGEKKPRELVVCSALQACSVEFIYTMTKGEGEQEIKKVAQWSSDRKDKEDVNTKVPLFPQMMGINMTIADDSLKLSRSIQYHIPIYVYESVLEQQQAKQDKKQLKGLSKILAEPEKPMSVASQQGRSFTKKFLLGIG